MGDTRTYLELTDPNRFHPTWTGVAGVRVDRVEGCPASFFRYLYQEVGRAYGWADRIEWTDDQITRHLADPAVSLWLMTVANAPAASPSASVAITVSPAPVTSATSRATAG